MTRIAIGMLLLGAAGTSALAQPPGSLDWSDGRRVSGWVPAVAVGDAVVGVFVDREAAGVPDFQGTATSRRPDLREAGINGFGFDVIIARPFRDGQRHALTAAIPGPDGEWVALPGSPREVLCEPLLQMPEPLAEAERAPIPATAEIWYGAEDTWALPIEEVWDSFGAMRDEWSFVQDHVQALALHNNNIAKGNLDQLRDIRAVVEANALRVVAEIGGLEQWQASKGDQFGEASAREEMEWSKLWWTAPEEGGCGGRYDYVILDDPIYRGLFPADKDENRDLDEIANETADAILVWKAQFPDIRPVLGCNFPNWGWKGGPAYYDMPTMKGPMGRGDYHPVLLRTVEVLRERGIELWGLILDTPYDYVEKLPYSNQRDLTAGVDAIARLRDVEETARSLGLRFGLYMNTGIADLEPEGIFTREERDRMYYVHTRNFFEAYRAAGGEPEFWSTYSWMKAPTKLVPETEPYTQSWNVSRYVERLRGLPPAQ